MKDIDGAKIRTAILHLKDQGKHDSANAVWDLLDAYYELRARMDPSTSAPADFPGPFILPQPTYRQGSSALEDALAGGFGPQDPAYVRDVLAKRDAEQASKESIPIPVSLPSVDLVCDIHQVAGGTLCMFRTIGYIRRTGQSDLHLCRFHSGNIIVADQTFIPYEN